MADRLPDKDKKAMSTSNVNDTDDYMKMESEKGSGPLRIGTRLALGEDMYSMFFTSCFDPYYVYYHEKV